MAATALSTVQWMERDGAAIAKGLRRRDSDVLDRLIEQYQHRLFRYLVYLTGRHELAEDLFQETWIRVLERGTQYDPSCRFDTWLFAIARHLVIDAARRKQMLSLEALTQPTDYRVPVEFASSAPPPDVLTSLSEDRARLGIALSKLEVVQREVVLLRFQEEMSLEEISRLTGAPLSTVKSRLYRGLEAMRPVLESLEQPAHSQEVAQ
jgi:RNA polymerase sigma-70 factor (ECF subfamily)